MANWRKPAKAGLDNNPAGCIACEFFPWNRNAFARRIYPGLASICSAKVRSAKVLGQVEGPEVASVKERIVEIVSEQLGVNKDQINDDTHFVNDIGADSLDTVELVMELEEEFDINIPDDAAEKIQTVGEAIEFIEKHVS